MASTKVKVSAQKQMAELTKQIASLSATVKALKSERQNNNRTTTANNQLQILAEEKVTRWSAKNKFAKPTIARVTATKVFIDYNSYGNRIRKPYSLKVNREGTAYLKKHKGKVVGKAIRFEAE
jgi:hypothetical protein